ncbi:MAG TPA: sugar transferase [Candidatus Eisenbacteria bacterium]|nr:sugar transferase [Candidatus Eisenbacteria bacterium]
MIALDAVDVKVAPPIRRPDLIGLEPDGNWSRWWQVLIAAVGLLVTLPISLAVALATKLTSRGPVLYRGTRIGRNMEPFGILKFRTLLVDAEQRIGARLLTPGDPLYTPVGRFLKRTKLDEIPQLINVVKGDMNLVGPRPIRPVFLATSMREIENYAARFIVRPGMTGLAQLRGGYFTHPRDKLRYDVLYIRNRSMRLDVKLVLGTFVKLLNRWLTLGLLLALVFLSASFLPALFRGPFQVDLGGFHVSPFEAIGVLLVGAALARQMPAHRLYLYRTPTNWPMLAFVVFAVATAFATGEVVPRLRDLAYFTASGFLLFFLVVSGDMDAGFARRATRVVALAAVAVACVGILELMLETQAGGDRIPRIASTLGSPVVLAAYLVLGLPLVLVELVCAEQREERDFWVVCTTLVVIGVVLTQTRTSLIALWLAAAVFTWRLSGRTFRLVVGSALAFLSMLVLVGALELSPSDLRADWSRRVGVTTTAIETDLWSSRGLIGTEPGKGAASVVAVPEGPGGETHRMRNENMHLTLMLRTGLVGWGLMMWIVGAALAGMYRGMSAVTDRRLALTLWAAFSSAVGFLVSMSNFNAFYNPTIQIVFWGLLGLGTAIATHAGGRRPSFNVIYRFGQGE